MNTEDKKLYIQIPCSEELPEINESVTVYSEAYTGSKNYPCLAYYNGEIWVDREFEKNECFKEIESEIDYWLKPVSESKVAIDFAEWCLLNYEHSDEAGKFIHSTLSNAEDMDSIYKFSISELQKEFLKIYKG